MVLVLLAVAMPALGAPATVDEARTQAARSHFELGRVLFKDGKYEDALREFKQGYELIPQPRFLVNIAQCHRFLGRHDKAVEALEKFLKDAPNDADRPRAEELLAMERVEAAKMP